MKRLLLTCFALLATVTIYSQQWYHTYLSHARDANAVKVLAKDAIIVGGGNEWNDSIQTLLRSSSYGMFWDINPTDNISSWIKSVAFIDTSTGFAVGYNGKMLRTANGGRTWSFGSSPILRHLNKVIYADATTLYAVGGFPAADSIQTVLKSTDGGLNWTVAYDQLGPWLKSVYFFDATTGIAVGDSGTILKTTNGGTVWAPVSSPVVRNFTDITFVNATTGFISGGKRGSPAQQTILTTTDGGDTWSVALDITGPALNAVTFLDALNGYVVGDSATVLSTTNGGVNWNPVVIAGANAYAQFNAVDFLAPDFGVIGGKGGDVFVYTNSSLPAVVTGGSNFIDTSSVYVFADINTHGVPAQYSFIYSTDSAFSSAQATWPVVVVSDSLTSVTEHLMGLTAHTKYYYYVEAASLDGPVDGSIRSFVTTAPAYTFQTSGTTNATNTSVTLMGEVNKLPSVTNLYFDYGTTPQLGQTIAASPAVVNDTLAHTVTAQLSNLNPFVVYYYRLRGVSGAQTYVGNVYNFTLGVIYTTLQTDTATNVAPTTATLNATVFNFRVPASFDFEYGTNPQFGNSIAATPATINDTLTHHLIANITNLQPYTAYYYRVKATTGSGTFWGASQVFYSGLASGVFETRTATNTLPGAATLNGYVSGLSATTTLEFEYGPTPALGTTVPAGTISDNLPHAISVPVTGLTVNGIYFYRIKGTIAGSTLTGVTKQVFAGRSEVPNWDFQNWTSETTAVPLHWNMVSKNFERIAGHSGNYALKLNADNLCLLGVFGDNLIGGQAFSSRPDSLIAYLNYAVEPGDSAVLLLVLAKGGVPVSQQFYMFGGSTFGTFKRFALPITYSSAVVPDSLTIGFVSTNPFASTYNSHPTSFIAFDDLSFSPASQPILNGNMEQWIDYPYEQADEWHHPLFIGIDSADFSQPEVRKIIHTLPDDYAVEITPATLNGTAFPSDFSNIMKVMGPDVHGSPVLAKHQTLNGYYRYFPVPGDTMSISVTLYANGQDVAGGQLNSGDTVADFTPFEITLNYMNPNAVPDSAVFALGPVRGKVAKGLSRLAVDKLSFDGFAGIDTTNALAKVDEEIKAFYLFPNPANNRLNLVFNKELDKGVVMKIVSLTGQIVKEFTIPQGSNQYEVALDVLQPGMYIALITNGGHPSSKRFLIIRP